MTRDVFFANFQLYESEKFLLLKKSLSPLLIFSGHLSWAQGSESKTGYRFGTAHQPIFFSDERFPAHNSLGCMTCATAVYPTNGSAVCLTCSHPSPCLPCPTEGPSPADVRHAAVEGRHLRRPLVRSHQQAHREAPHATGPGKGKSLGSRQTKNIVCLFKCFQWGENCFILDAIYVFFGWLQHLKNCNFLSE